MHHYPISENLIYTNTLPFLFHSALYFCLWPHYATALSKIRDIWIGTMYMDDEFKRGFLGVIDILELDNLALIDILYTLLNTLIYA